MMSGCPDLPSKDTWSPGYPDPPPKVTWFKWSPGYPDPPPKVTWSSAIRVRGRPWFGSTWCQKDLPQNCGGCSEKGQLEDLSEDKTVTHAKILTE